jgi:hypothetical protein
VVLYVAIEQSKPKSVGTRRGWFMPLSLGMQARTGGVFADGFPSNTRMTGGRVKKPLEWLQACSIARRSQPRNRELSHQRRPSQAAAGANEPGSWVGRAAELGKHSHAPLGYHRPYVSFPFPNELVLISNILRGMGTPSRVSGGV